MIKLIIFDLWNTLAKIHGKSTTEGIMRVFNLNISKEKCRKIYEQSFQTKKYNSKYEAYKQLCLDFGIFPDNEIIENLSRMFEENIESIDLFPQTINMLKSLKERGFKIGLISNSSESVVQMIREETQLFKYIDYPLFSFDCGIIKPDFEIFNIMLNKTKCKPKDCLMIGDSIIDDIEPAKKLGIKTLLFIDYKQLKKGLGSFGILAS